MDSVRTTQYLVRTFRTSKANWYLFENLSKFTKIFLLVVLLLGAIILQLSASSTFSTLGSASMKLVC
ncbi:MAG: hypothetical protein LBP35_06035 [Candidatus Ancillula trichonymphae]|nr:hypothetical protein [Candidatus Ancillula trichonymphae]